MKNLRGKSVKKWVSIAAAGVLLLLLAFINPFWMLEYRIEDMSFQRPGMPNPNIIVVGIDDITLAELGPLHQWSRTGIAQAIQTLNRYDDYRPAVIAIDLLFTERSLIPEIDIVLAEAAAEANNVLVASRLEMGFDFEALSLEIVPLRHQRPFDKLLPYVEHGLINGIIDRDGFVRNASLYQHFQGQRLYSFPVMAAKMYLGTSSIPFLETHSKSYIRYTGLPGYPGDFFELSFSGIFEENFDPSWMAGAIVLIGPYAAGMMDHFPVPIKHGAFMFGVEIHANVIQMILEENFTVPAPDWVRLLIIALMLILGMILGELLDIRLTMVLFLLLGAGYYVLAQAIFHKGYLLPIFIPLLALGMIFIYQLVYGYILHMLEKLHIRSIFKKYVDPKLADKLLDDMQANINAVGVKRHIAVLFVDVRGFTPMTEALRDTPEQIVEILNEYLELTSRSVFDNGGSVDKFIGDATMALFNGFVPLDDYVYKAVKTAWDMVQGAAALNASIKERFGVDVGFGVGIHCGEAIVGNLGPAFRKDYTAIGDAVNTAARLESNAKPSQVIISKDVYSQIASQIEVQPLGEIQLKGKSEPMEVFALTGIKAASVDPLS